MLAPLRLTGLRLLPPLPGTRLSELTGLRLLAPLRLTGLLRVLPPLRLTGLLRLTRARLPPRLGGRLLTVLRCPVLAAVLVRVTLARLLSLGPLPVRVVRSVRAAHRRLPLTCQVLYLP
ncbi:hypothetical protein FXW78_30460 [Rhodococcus opacus]|nr:hypothetical protein [Rhodococcus opacus]